MTKFFEFPTEAEASAFAQGVDFVNDSAIEVISIRAVEGGYCVTVEDEDAHEETGAVRKTYPLADHATLEERPGAVTQRYLRCVGTGEFRPPKKGEWYLSGAIVAGYKAPNDLSSPYWIARLTVVPGRLP